MNALALRLHQVPSKVRAENPRDLATLLDIIVNGY